MPLDIDVYANAELSGLAELQDRFDGRAKRFFPFLYHWDWNAWYGRNRQVAFVMSFLKRLPLHGRIVQAVLAEHRRQPYDAVIQFSQGELFSLGRHVEEVPVLLFPCVHAAGELFWCRREESFARRCEPWVWRKIRNLYMAFRARLQQRDYHQARGMIGMSRRFNRCVERDYGLAPSRMGVVYHPIEAAPLIAGPTTAALQTEGAVRLLFVGRISVRKGVEMLTALVAELLVLDAGVTVQIIGGGSLWSNYELLLEGLPSTRCRWVKSLPNDKVVAEMGRADILLVPSHYEPGGIVVGEALANGMIVVASNEVGSAENLPASVCHEFRAGDQAGFLAATLRAIASVRQRGPVLRTEAASVAQREFDPHRMTEHLLSEVSRLLSGSPQGKSSVPCR